MLGACKIVCEAECADCSFISKWFELNGNSCPFCEGRGHVTSLVGSMVFFGMPCVHCQATGELCVQ